MQPSHVQPWDRGEVAQISGTMYRLWCHPGHPSMLKPLWDPEEILTCDCSLHLGGGEQNFLGKRASKRASKLAELLPQGMNLHTHFDPFMIFLFVLATSSSLHHSAKDALN